MMALRLPAPSRKWVISINDLPEAPGNYVNASLSVSGFTATEITLSWNNEEYEEQFDEFDRGLNSGKLRQRVIGQGYDESGHRRYRDDPDRLEHE